MIPALNRYVYDATSANPDLVAYGNGIGPESQSVSCNCLNVRFNLSNLADAESVDDHHAHNFNAPACSLLTAPKIVTHEFAALANHGAQIAIPYLVMGKDVKGWKLFTCFNCKITTHIVNMNAQNVVFVNFGSMLQQEQQDWIISSNPSYSKLFGILAKAVEGSHSVISMKPSVMDVVRDIKDRAANFLSDEKANMQERIRRFEASQLAMYHDVESSVSVSKQNLENQIWAAFNEENDDVDSAYERSVEEISPDDSQITAGKKERSSSLLDDFFFDLDPLDDQDDVDDDDNLFTDEDTDIPNYQSRGANYGAVDILAKSVPIPIMRQFRVSTSRASGSFSDEDTTPKPQDMQASIRALAQSVGGDGTEMFGDLPRPRFNTQRANAGEY